MHASGARDYAIARAADVEAFYRELAGGLSPFVLYGSGDFHHLTALWIRRLDEPVVELWSLDQSRAGERESPAHQHLGVWEPRTGISALVDRELFRATTPSCI